MYIKTPKNLSDIGLKLKKQGLSSYSREYVKLYKREQRYLYLISKIRGSRIPEEDFNEEDILYIKSIAICKK